MKTVMYQVSVCVCVVSFFCVVLFGGWSLESFYVMGASFVGIHAV